MAMELGVKCFLRNSLAVAGVTSLVVLKPNKNEICSLIVYVYLCCFSMQIYNELMIYNSIYLNVSSAEVQNNV